MPRSVVRTDGPIGLSGATRRSSQIAYLGLLPERVGRGLGRYLREAAIAEAARLWPVRIWLHTCTLDHPSALPNYRARGFQELRTEHYAVEATVEEVLALVRSAIVARRQLLATYRELPLETCLHVLGRCEGRAVGLFYQFGGVSGEGGEAMLRDGTTDNWRCMAVDELFDVRLRDGQWFTDATVAARPRCVEEIDARADPAPAESE